MPLLRKLFRKRMPNRSSTVNKNEQPVTPYVEENLKILAQNLGFTEELEVRTIGQEESKYVLAYLSSYVDVNQLQNLLDTVLLNREKGILHDIIGEEKAKNFSSVIDLLSGGYAALFTEGEPWCRLIPAPLNICREPKQPTHQKSINGPKDGFVEDVRTNLFLLRKKLKDEKLRVRRITAGRRSKTSVHVLFIEDLAQPEIVDSVIQRIRVIDTDVIMDNIVLAQYLADSWLSPFPQLEITERPDVVASSLCQGRVAILHETSPGVLLAPTVFFDLIDIPDDYYNSWSVSSSIIRFIRLTTVLLAILLPAFYIALTAYNVDFIPTHLAMLIAISREGVPFPIPLEAFLVVSIFEIAREAIYILPTMPAAIIIGIVAVTLNVLAVAANYFSAIMVAIIFFGGICSSVIPDKDLRISIRELQFFVMILASFFGILGVGMAFFYIAIHAVNLKSFGIPYLSPLAPLNPSDWKRILFRFPAWAMPRLKTYHPQDEERQDHTVDRKEGAFLEKKPR